MINIEDWNLVGGGVQGDSYFHKTDPEVMLKLYSQNVSRDYVQKEFDFSCQIANAGVQSPDALEMVQYGNRYGIIFKRIHNKKSFARLAGDNPEMIEPLAKRLAVMIKELQSKSSEGLSFTSSIQLYQDLLDRCDFLDDNTKSRIQKALDFVRTEDCNNLVHGDFHFGNIITDGDKDYFIDLGNLSYGNPKTDIAMFYIVTHYAGDAMVYDIFHMHIPEALRFWKAFKIEYYGFEKSDSEVFDEVREYMLIRSMWIRQDTGNAPFAVRMMELLLQDDCPLEDRSF